VAASLAVAIRQARLLDRLKRDAQSKESLLQEMNHRVKNNLTAILGLLYAEQRHVGLAHQEIYQTIMKSLISRVQGLTTVHRMLSDSQWSPILLDDLVTQVIQSSVQILPPDQHIVVDVSPSAVRVNARQASSLALVLNELVTNAVKHSLRNRRRAMISVAAATQSGSVRLEFRCDGPGYPEEVLAERKLGVGMYLARRFVQTELRGSITLLNDNGAVTIIQFDEDLSNRYYDHSSGATRVERGEA
jgi:two-component sensor histidine kinase